MTSAARMNSKRKARLFFLHLGSKITIIINHELQFQQNFCCLKFLIPWIQTSVRKVFILWSICSKKVFLWFRRRKNDFKPVYSCKPAKVVWGEWVPGAPQGRGEPRGAPPGAMETLVCMLGKVVRIVHSTFKGGVQLFFFNLSHRLTLDEPNFFSFYQN